MTRKIIRTLALALLLLAPGVALAEGAIVGHYSDCPGTGEFFVMGPDGNIVRFTWENNPGDFRRTNADGSGWVNLADGHATVTVLSPAFAPIAVGEGSFSASLTAFFFDLDPCGAYTFDGGHIQLHITAAMTDLATDQEFHLVVEAVFHNGEFKVLKVLQ